MKNSLRLPQSLDFENAFDTIDFMFRGFNPVIEKHKSASLCYLISHQRSVFRNDACFIFLLPIIKTPLARQNSCLPSDSFSNFVKDFIKPHAGSGSHDINIKPCELLHFLRKKFKELKIIHEEHMRHSHRHRCQCTKPNSGEKTVGPDHRLTKKRTTIAVFGIVVSGASPCHQVSCFYKVHARTDREMEWSLLVHAKKKKKNSTIANRAKCSRTIRYGSDSCDAREQFVSRRNHQWDQVSQMFANDVKGCFLLSDKSHNPSLLCLLCLILFFNASWANTASFLQFV